MIIAKGGARFLADDAVVIQLAGGAATLDSVLTSPRHGRAGKSVSATEELIVRANEQVYSGAPEIGRIFGQTLRTLSKKCNRDGGYV